MCAVGGLAQELLAFEFLLLLAPLAVDRIEPGYIVTVLLDGDFDLPGFLHVDDVLDIFEGQRSAAIHIEVRLEVPVAGLGEERGPRRIAELGILSVHGGVPQPVAQGVRV